MTPQPTPHELAMQAREVFDRNLDTLVAGFLIRNPDIDPSTVRINLEVTPNGLSAFVTPVQIQVPGEKPDPFYEEGTDPFEHARREAYVDGWNACREELINTLQSMQQPPVEDADE